MSADNEIAMIYDKSSNKIYVGMVYGCPITATILSCATRKDMEIFHNEDVALAHAEKLDSEHTTEYGICDYYIDLSKHVWD